jgi:hypothetical protein
MLANAEVQVLALELSERRRIVRVVLGALDGTAVLEIRFR